MTKGDPLAIIAYGISILTLIKNIKREIPDVTQTWYTGDIRALRIFTRTETYFNYLAHQGPGRGYYTKPSKSMLIMHPENLEAEIVFGLRHEFKVYTVARYLRSYIGDGESRKIG